VEILKRFGLNDKGATDVLKNAELTGVLVALDRRFGASPRGPEAVVCLWYTLTPGNGHMRRDGDFIVQNRWPQGWYGNRLPPEGTDSRDEGGIGPLPPKLLYAAATKAETEGEREAVGPYIRDQRIRTVQQLDAALGYLRDHPGRPPARDICTHGSRW